LLNRFYTRILPLAAGCLKEIPHRFVCVSPPAEGRVTSRSVEDTRPPGRAANRERSRSNRSMQYRQLGPFRVSVVALGTMSVAPGLMHQAIDEAQAADTVAAALDCGINLIDTAPAYGEAEERLGRALAGRRRDSYVLATKASGPTLSAAEVTADCEASLRRLNVEYVDLYQIHWQKRVVPLAETLLAMDALARSGKVRAIGLCNSGPNDLAEAMDCVPIVSDQVVYNLLSRAAEFELLPACGDRGVGVLCYSPLAQGLLAGRYASPDDVPPERARSRHFNGNRPMSRHGEAGWERETFAAIDAVRAIADDAGMNMCDLASAWLLHRPGVTSVLAGASTREQVRANARAADVTLSPEVIRRLDAATDDLKRKMGPNLDMWQGGKDSRVR
jgi:aryl-alcohol dehydrogenase-like predicted oxidoreductase